VPSTSLQVNPYFGYWRLSAREQYSPRVGDIIAGCVMIVWPTFSVWQWRRACDRIATRGGNPERMRALMTTGWWRATMWLMRLGGVAVIALVLVK
jgi:hypothetical protein